MPAPCTDAGLCCFCSHPQVKIVCIANTCADTGHTAAYAGSALDQMGAGTMKALLCAVNGHNRRWVQVLGTLHPVRL